MNYVVEISENIDFAPGTVAAEIIQNVRTILHTMRGSAPMMRGFGVDSQYIDMPLNVTRAALQADIAEQIAINEPRAVVNSITWNGDTTGNLTPAVSITIDEAYT